MSKLIVLLQAQFTTPNVAVIFETIKSLLEATEIHHQNERKLLVWGQIEKVCICGYSESFRVKWRSYFHCRRTGENDARISMNGEDAYGVQYMNQCLLERYGADIIIAENDDMAYVVTWKKMQRKSNKTSIKQIESKLMRQRKEVYLEQQQPSFSQIFSFFFFVYPKLTSYFTFIQPMPV